MSSTETTRSIVDRFNEAFNRHDADALSHLLTDDTVFENTSPPPDGATPAGTGRLAALCVAVAIAVFAGS